MAANASLRRRSITGVSERSLFALCVTLSIVCVLSLAVPAAFAATPWTEHDFSSTSGERIESAQVLTASDGTQNAAWKRYYGGNETPVFERTRANGEVSVGPVVLSNTGRQTFSVSEATTPNDTTYFIWDETGVGVQADLITPSGEIRQLPMLTSGPTSATEVSVSVNEQGNAVVVWGYPKLEYAVINPAGEVVKQQLIQEENGRERSIATTPVPNGVFVAWTERTESGYVVKATRISETPNEPGGIFAVSTNPSEAAYELHVAANATGDVVASWAIENYSPSWEASVRAAVVPASSSTPRQEVTVAQPGEYYGERSAPYIYPTGTAGVAAIAYHETGPAELIITPINTNGEAESTYVVSTTDGAESPSVAVNVAGKAFLTWVEETGGTPRAETAELTEHTTPQNTETLLTPNAPTSTFTTINANGELVLATYGYSPSFLRSYVRPTLNACGAGTYSSTGEEPCTPAQPGYYVAGSGATTQTPCAAGTFAAGTKNEECSLASPGHYVESAASATQATCSAGTYSAATGATSCAITPAGYYSGPGSTTPTPCPAGTESAAGASSCKAKSAEGVAKQPELPPVLTSVSVSHRCTTPVTLGDAPLIDAKLELSYTVNEASTITFTVAHRTGSPAWAYCPARRGKQPGTYESVWSATTATTTTGGHTVGLAKAASVRVTPGVLGVGKHSIALAAAIADSGTNAKALKPGTYILTVQAKNAEGEESATQTVKFWIVKPAVHTSHDRLRR
jgi:hypothetical protein